MENKIKKGCIFVISIVFAMGIAIQSLSAQTIHKATNGQSFVEEPKKIYNRSFTSYPDSLFATEGFLVKNQTLVADVVKNTLSSQRLSQLKNKRMMTIVKCDTEGKIIGIKFLFPKDVFLTVDEIAEIEEALSAERFDIESNIGNDYGILFALPYNFSNIQ